MKEGDVLLLGHEGPLARELAEALGARLHGLARGAPDGELERWRAEVAGGPARARVVVALGHDPLPEALGLCELEPEAWGIRAEEPFLAWCVALGAAAARCADGGAIVAVAEAPSPLDAAGFAPEAGLAEGVGALVRSIARAEGGRGVRANLVTTPARLPLAPLPEPAPPLPAFPGRLAAEVAGAVRLLLSEEAKGLTGRTIPADCGRSW